MPDDTAIARLVAVRAQVQAAEVKRNQGFANDAKATAQASDELVRLRKELDRLQSRVAALTVRAASSGRVSIDASLLRPGAFIEQGQTIAHVLDNDAPMIRAFIDEQDVALVRTRLQAIRVTVADNPGQTQSARLIGLVPRAVGKLPSAALARAGGGSIATDPTDASGLQVASPMFQVDLQLTSDAASTAMASPIGARSIVTFEHGNDTAAELLIRTMRQAFMRHLPI